jgi:hypothetical protein
VEDTNQVFIRSRYRVVHARIKRRKPVPDLFCFISTIAFISTAEITMIAATSPGAQIAINETGQFVGNVSETIAENPISTNITGETQEYFADKAK